MTVVITGNPVDGFTFWGPFDDSEAAIEWAERSNIDGDWWIADVESPK